LASRRPLVFGSDPVAVVIVPPGSLPLHRRV
jgi:hypothetical protein